MVKLREGNAQEFASGQLVTDPDPKPGSSVNEAGISEYLPSVFDSY
jgi:hypothetical protein